MMRVTDRLIAPARGDRVTAINAGARLGAKRLNDVDAYVTEVYRLAPLVGIDPAIVVAQAFHETGNFTSRWWVERLNPAGIGITGDPAQNEASRTWASGTDAARSHAAHALVYAMGPSDAGSLWFRVVGGDPIARVDPRYDAYLTAYGNVAKAETLADLAGTWAADLAYHTKIVEKSRAIFPGIPDQQTGETPTVPLDMTRGLIPLPPMESSIVDVSKRCQGPNDNRGFDWIGERTIRGVVLHRSQGTWTSNQHHFHAHCPGALTDIQVDHTDGRMMRFVRLEAPPGHVNSPSGWANGRVEGAYGDGKRFVDRYGVAAVNRDLESCEITGYFVQPGVTVRRGDGSIVTVDDAVSDACWETLAQWIASRAHDYGIRYETFPLIPSEGNRSFVIWHQEFTLGTGKVCPGQRVIDGTTALLDRARAIMLEAQTGARPMPEPEPTPTPEPDPSPSPWPAKRVPAPDGFTTQGIEIDLLEEQRFKTKRFRCLQGGRFRTGPSRDAPIGVASPYRAGRAYRFVGIAPVDGELWIVSSAGSWAPLKNFEAVI